MEQYIVKFWCKNKESGFVEKKEELFYAKGKNAHKRVMKMCMNKHNVKKDDIIFCSYC